MKVDNNLPVPMVWMLTPDPIACYQALLARDRQSDGLFFNCVKTTGIYCRPICPARTPKPENCLFVASAAAAQGVGFRPCLQCHPESAPDFGAWRGSSAVVSRAMALIEEGALDAYGTLIHWPSGLELTKLTSINFSSNILAHHRSPSRKRTVSYWPNS